MTSSWGSVIGNMSDELISIVDEKATVELTVDDEKVSVPEGTSIYDAVIGMGKTIPSMCYHYTFNPFGSCGVCLVEVEGKKAPVRSCTSPVAAGGGGRGGTARGGRA